MSLPHHNHSTPTLNQRIKHLALNLRPLVRMPNGPVHPAYPRTLLAFHLLTEDDLDALAHYYHQSTPGPMTNQYPATMNWDREWLARPQAQSPQTSGRHGSPDADAADAQAEVDEEAEWVQNLLKAVQHTPGIGSAEDGSGLLVSSPTAPVPGSARRFSTDEEAGGLPGLPLPSHPASSRGSARARGGNVHVHPYAGLSDAQRIAIKRRKVGKFIGLLGMETPAEEIEGRVRAGLERAVELRREEMRRVDEAVMRRRKI